MALVNLKTDLKSLKYTNKPYVTKDINAPRASIDERSNFQKRFEDVDRLAAMFADKPGADFVRNYTRLSQLDTRPQKVRDALESKNEKLTLVQRIKTSAKRSLVTVGNVIPSILDNARGAGTGFHENLGYSPVSAGSTINDDNLFSSIQEFFSTEQNGLGYQNSSAYLGASYSAYSLNGALVPVSRQFPTVFSQLSSEFALQSSSLWNSSKGIPNPNQVFPTGSTKILTGDGSINPVTYNLSEGSHNKERRSSLGNQSIRTREQRIDYTSATPELAIDKVNTYSIKTGLENTNNSGKPTDLIDFMFNIITPDNAEQDGHDLYFRAYLETLQDNFSSNWSTHKYLGRAEDFHTYSGFSRSISLSFKIAAATKAEMLPLYNKINYLASTTAPTYSPTGNFMRGTLVRLTVGDYFRQQAGFINTINFNWQKDYPWDISLPSPIEGEENVERMQLPHLLDCTVSFTPIHNFAPKATTVKDEFGNIGLENKLISDNNVLAFEKQRRENLDNTLSIVSQTIR